jgi:AcrR family transcriptional regulator
MRVADPSRGEQILETAARLFDKRHYHEVRMEDLAAQAGVAKGTLYRYFQDKEDLYIALLLSATLRFCKEMDVALEGVKCPEEKIRIFLRRSVAFFDEYPYFLDLMQRVESSVEAKRMRPLLDARQSFFDTINAIIAELAATGRYRIDDPQMAALALTGMNRQMHRFYPKPWPADLPERMADFFFRGLKAGPETCSRRL